MYKGFLLDSRFDVGVLEELSGQGDISGEIFESGRERTDKIARDLSESVRSLKFGDDRVINGDLLEAKWFPQLGFDVFISHSHADREMAVALAGGLWKFFGLEAFVDSCVWGCRDELIQKMREQSGNLPPSRPCINYDDENAIITHADIMLNNSLLRMIDRCECMMFLETGNSIERKDSQADTFSAWLYSELTIAKFIRKTEPDRPRRKMLKESALQSKEYFSLIIKHKADTGTLSSISIGQFLRWGMEVKRRGLTGRMTLDSLYDIIGC